MVQGAERNTMQPYTKSAVTDSIGHIMLSDPSFSICSSKADTYDVVFKGKNDTIKGEELQSFLFVCAYECELEREIANWAGKMERHDDECLQRRIERLQF